MIMEPLWRGILGEAQALQYGEQSLDELIHRSILYGLELSRGCVAEVETVVARKDFPNADRWEAVHKCDQAIAQLIKDRMKEFDDEF